MAIKLNRKGVGLSGANLDKENENLDLIEQEFNRVGNAVPMAEDANQTAEVAIKTANSIKGVADTARLTADEAKSAASAAKSTSENVQKQLSTLVLQGDSSPQATQASIGADGTDYGGSLKARLDAEQNKVRQQLVDTSKRKDFVRYGKILMPPDFPVTLPLSLYRKYGENRITHDFDFDALVNSSTATVYLNTATGNTAFDGLSPSTPARHFSQAMTIAAGLSDKTVTIALMNSTISYTDFNSVYEYTLNKNIILKSHNGSKVVVHSGRTSSTFTWTADGAAWKTARSAVSRVLDASKVDYRGNTKELIKLNSVVEVQATPDSWYTDGVSVWIRRANDVTINNDIIMSLPLASELRFIKTGHNLIIDNIEFLFESTTGNALYLLSGTSNGGRVYHRNSAFAYAKVNGLRTDKQQGTYGFNSRAYSNGSDGFNYHGQLVVNPYEFAFEYYCQAHDNGATIASTGNATTAHEGMTTLRVGTLGYECFGPLCADVNGCYSVLVDCTMYDSKRPAGSTKSAFFFDGAGAVKRGKAYLINCGGGGIDTHTINTDGNVDVYVKNLIGNQIPETMALNYLA